MERTVTTSSHFLTGTPLGCPEPYSYIEHFIAIMTALNGAQSIIGIFELPLERRCALPASV